MASLPSYRSTLLGALLLLHCGGQSTDLFEDSPGGAGTSANAGRAGGSAAGATGGSTTGGSKTGGSTTGGSTTGGSTTGGSKTGGAGAGAAGGSAGSGGSGTSGGGGAGAGGADATGGAVGAGGVAGSDAAGSGGTSGSGGGEGGLSGQGGTGTAGRGGDDCAALRQELTSTLAEARVCNLALSSRLACTGQVVNECGCPVVVDWDDSVASRRYRVLMKQFNERCSIACPAIVCREPLSGRCETSGSGVMGTCEPLLGSAR